MEVKSMDEISHERVEGIIYSYLVGDEDYSAEEALDEMRQTHSSEEIQDVLNRYEDYYNALNREKLETLMESIEEE